MTDSARLESQQVFRLPDLGEGLTEAEIVDWRVAVGDGVSVDQVVVEVETAKASVEIPIPFAGTVTSLAARPGQSVSVGEPLITVAAAAGGRGDAGGSGNVLIGYGTSSAGPRRDRTARRPRQQLAHQASAAATGSDTERVAVVSPLVRRIARESGVDLRLLHGTGPDGLILRRDVEHASGARTPTAGPIAPTPSASGLAQRIPLQGPRKFIADKLTRSRREIPEATVWVDVDATELLAARSALNTQSPDRPVSVLALISRFVILALRRYPELNGRVEGDEIVLPSSVNLGFAAQTMRGLVVPVVHDAQTLSTRDLSAALSASTDSARAGTVSPADMTGGTITVNNYGVFGVDGSAAIINHPEIGMVGLPRRWPQCPTVACLRQSSSQRSPRARIGDSTQSATSRRNPPAVPPSQTRWSKASVSWVTLRTARAPSTTQGRAVIRPIPTMAISGWLMMAAEPSTPNTP
jgi:pyruvate dehydrogenase E2 component (dihydrolipoamide acetyltransferase)